MATKGRVLDKRLLQLEQALAADEAAQTGAETACGAADEVEQTGADALAETACSPDDHAPESPLDSTAALPQIAIFAKLESSAQAKAVPQRPV